MPDDNAQGAGQGDTGTGGGEGQGTAPEGGKGFLGSLPENLRTNEHLKGFQDHGALAQAYLDTRQKMPVVPEKMEGYEISKTPIDGVELPDEGIQLYRTVAHELKLTQEQANALVKIDQQRLADGRKAAKERRETAVKEAETQLKKDWGGDFDKRVGRAESVIGKFGPKEFPDWLKQTGLNNHPLFIRFMDAVGSQFTEDQLHEGKPAPGDNKRPQSEDGRPRLKFASMGDT